MKPFTRVLENNILILSIITLTFCLASNARILNSSASSRIQRQKLKYILQWETPNKEPLILGQQVFIDKKCAYTNCYILTTKRGMPKSVDYTKYDVILFGPDLTSVSLNSLPKDRSPHQKYVFISSEPSDSYPLKAKLFDGYFNWTWTYRLDSDLTWGSPFVVKTDNKRIVAPRYDTNWVDDGNMPPIQNEVKYAISNKRRAVAWFVSNCNTQSRREILAEKLSKVLLSRYNMHLDIYGKCGQYSCPKEMREPCDEFIRDNYFFYLAYEKSLSEGYVSDQLLHAIKHYTVPIVYGGANYSRWLPNNSYINAINISTDKLAKKINEAVRNPHIYQSYLKWNFYYSVHRTEESPDTDDYCRMCALLNDKKKVQKSTVHNNFTNWWTLPLTKHDNESEVSELKVRTEIKTVNLMQPVYIDPEDSNWFITLYKDAKTEAKSQGKKAKARAKKLRDRIYRILRIK